MFPPETVITVKLILEIYIQAVLIKIFDHIFIHNIPGAIRVKFSLI